MTRKCANCLYWSANHIPPAVGEGMFPCWHPSINEDRGGEHGTDCEFFLGSDSALINVPNHLLKGTMTDPNPNKISGGTEILIVTYWKDFPWLVYCLKSIQRYCRGFTGVTVMVPDRDIRLLFQDVMPECTGPVKITPIAYPEVEGKGMVQHMAIMASADRYVESYVHFVLHCDADCIFKMPTTPEHYFWNDKPYQIVRTWDSLTTEDPRVPGSKVVSDCLQWRQPTATQLGFDSPWYTMCMNTAVFPIGFYRRYREHIENVHRQAFETVILAGRNEFPQTSMDWTAMGAYAERHMHDQFHWFDVEKPPYPADRKQAFWSHGGINPEVRKEIEALLNRYVPTDEEAQRMAQ